MRIALSGWRLPCFSALTGMLWCVALPHAAAEPNRMSNYLLNGATVSGWQLALGDERNWLQPQNEGMGLSENKAISFNYQDHALNVRWRSSKQAGLISIHGEAIDLSQLDDTIALALELKVHSHKLKKPVELSVSCGSSCQGTVTLNPLLDLYPRNQWITLPLPLRCFKNSRTDFSKVDSPFSVYSKGELEITFRNVKLVKIPADFDLCKNQ